MNALEFSNGPVDPERISPPLEIDSGSAYEDSSSADEENLSHDEVFSRRRMRKRSTDFDQGSEDIEDLHRRSRSQTSYTEDRIRQDAIEWAARFEGPENGEVKSPTRHPAGTRSTKRKAELPPSQSRAKRLRGFYSNGYREILNADIYDAATRSFKEDQAPFESSQIGASVWTSKEKELFFTSLSRLGRDDIRGISNRIGTKSEPEVQEYIRLLHQRSVERMEEQHQTLIGETDFPAAVEISEECCSVLERAGDALANRQERQEEETEKQKWGESWLLTPDVCKWIEKHRKEDGGEHVMQEILPAVNLLNLKNWLFLSERIFMNPGPPLEEDNWQALAEPGESPAIRATAFTDFHSLAVSITKRLISTTLFCTMSKLRAMNSNKIKHAEIGRADVEAATKILGLKSGSNDFWTTCARRCSLQVFDDKNLSESSEKGYMAYDEVETALSANLTSKSSLGANADSEKPNNLLSELDTDIDGEEHIEMLSSQDKEYDESDVESLTEGESYESAHYIYTDNEDDDILLSLSDSEFANPDSRRFHVGKRAEARKANERAHERYTEAFDKQANEVEEQHLWTLLRQAPPFEIKSELVDLPEPPKQNRRDTEALGTVDWRQNIEYWSGWETMERPVLRESFTRVAERKVQRNRRWARTKAKNIGSGAEQDRVATSDLEADDDSDGTLDEKEQSEVTFLVDQEVSCPISISPRRPSPDIPRLSTESSIKSQSDG